MILGIFTLVVAITISSVSAFYSMLGLTAIFPGSFWPIIIMGGALELGKLSSVIWLHYNWERATWKIKSYLWVAVIILAGITSMGVFGALSKAHLDQTIPSGDVQAQVSLFDEKIKTQRDNIESSRKALTQMDGAVDQILSRTADENGATKSANLRRSQGKERTRLQNDIDTSQKEITKLQEARAPIASKYRQAVAEVGPIRYIAALIYGDKASQDMLEAAVRWVIIIIVFVFDPLAIILLLAATTSIDWANKEREQRKAAKQALALIPVPEPISAPPVDEFKQVIESINSQHATEINKLDKAFADLGDQHRTTCITLSAEQEINAIKDNEIAKLNAKLEGERLATLSLTGQKESLEEDLAQAIDSIAALSDQVDNLTQVVVTIPFPDITEAIIPVEPSVQSDIDFTVNPTVEFLNEPPQIVEPTIAPVLLPVRRDVQLPITSHPHASNANFGKEFPTNPTKGDLFLRVDYMPSKLFKWVDSWIELDKGVTDAFAYDREYIKLLVEKVGTGEYDIDDLNSTEQEQIANYLYEQSNS